MWVVHPFDTVATVILATSHAGISAQKFVSFPLGATTKDFGSSAIWEDPATTLSCV